MSAELPGEMYVRLLVESGASEEEARAIWARLDARAQSAQRGVCPDCGEQVTRALDARQDGPCKFPGLWVNYRCVARCGFMLDARESGENQA